MDTSDSNGYNNTRHPFKYKSKGLKYLRVMYTESLATHCNNTLQHTATHCNTQILARDVYRVTCTWYHNTRHLLESQLWSCPADSNGHNGVKQIQGFTSALTQMDTTLHNSADAKRCRESNGLSLVSGGLSLWLWGGYPLDTRALEFWIQELYLFDYGGLVVSRTLGLVDWIQEIVHWTSPPGYNNSSIRG